MSSTFFDHHAPYAAQIAPYAQKLLQRLIAHWPRRGSSLLEMGCAEGQFLHFFWESGFDVSGVDSSQAHLDKTRERLGHCAELHLGALDALPFDDNDFDYVVIPSALIAYDNARPILNEAMRVAARGVLVGYCNQYSAFWLSRRLGHSRTCENLHWHTGWELSKIARDFAPWKTCIAAVLPTPPCLWPPHFGGTWLNQRIIPLSLGAYAALRLDNRVPRASTPLHVRIKEKIVPDGYDLFQETMPHRTERNQQSSPSPKE